MPSGPDPVRAGRTAPVRAGRTELLRRHPFAARFLVASSLLFVITLMWSLASPIPSGPDEEAQLTKASAVAFGTLIGTPTHGRSDGTVSVKIRQTVADAQVQTSCDYFTIDVPSCSPLIRASSKVVTSVTYEGRYPPIYYFLTGLPTLVSGGDWTLHAMRVISALICSLLLGAAFACVAAYGRSGLLTVATALVVTPTVLYISAVVNPSALEIAGAIAMWAGLAVMVMHRAADPPMPTVVVAAAGAMAMCSSRPLSTGWYALILATFVALRPATCRALLRVRRVVVAFAVSLIFAFASGVFVLLAKSYELEAFPISKSANLSLYVLTTLGRGDRVLRQVIGAFGAPDFSVPLPVLAIWLIAGFGLILLGCFLAARRDALVLAVATVLFGFVLPFAIIFSHIRTDGVVWQGRYSLPLLAGLPMLAAVLIAERHPVTVAAALRRVTVVTIPAFTVGCVVAFYWFLRRYTVGLASYRTNAFHHYANSWSPVVPPALIFAVLVVASVVFALWLFRQTLCASGAAGQAAREGPRPVRSAVSTPPDLAESSELGPRPLVGQSRSSSQPSNGPTSPTQPL